MSAAHYDLHESSIGRKVNLITTKRLEFFLYKTATGNCSCIPSIMLVLFKVLCFLMLMATALHIN